MGSGSREMSVRYQSICWPLIPDLRVKDLSRILDESNQRNLLKCAYVNFFFLIICKMFQTQLTNHWNVKIELKYEEQVVIQDLLDLQFFPGSLDRNSPETQLLGTPVSAQYVRILPLEVNGQAGLRFDVLGCTPDCKETNFLPVLHIFFPTIVFNHQ